MSLANEKLVPVGELAQRYGYSRDHLAYLCRRGEMQGVKSGRTWMTTEEEVQRYQKAITEIQVERWDKMSKAQSLPETPKPMVVRFQPTKQLAKAPAPVGLAGKKDLLPKLLFDVAVFSEQTLQIVLAPLRTLFELLNFLLRKAHTLPDLPAKILRSFEFATEPVTALYKKYGSGTSLYRISKQAQWYRQSYAFGLSFFIAVTFTYSIANFAGVPVNNIAREKVAGVFHEMNEKKKYLAFENAASWIQNTAQGESPRGAKIFTTIRKLFKQTSDKVAGLFTDSQKPKIVIDTPRKEPVKLTAPTLVLLETKVVEKQVAVPGPQGPAGEKGDKGEPGIIASETKQPRETRPPGLRPGEVGQVAAPPPQGLVAGISNAPNIPAPYPIYIVASQDKNLSGTTGDFRYLSAQEGRLDILTVGNSASTTVIASNSVSTGEINVRESLTLGSITGSAQCLQVSTIGLVAGSGAACGSSGTPGAWETLFANALTPTSTTAGIFVNASSTFDSTLRVNGNLTLSGITGSTQCLQVSTIGLVAGSGAACGSSGTPGAWETLFANALTPTSTTAGIFVNASSTFDSTLRVNGALSVTTTIASSTIAHSLLVDGTTLVVNANEGRVGIGTANPGYKLDVVHATNDTYAIRGWGSAGSASGIYGFSENTVGVYGGIGGSGGIGVLGDAVNGRGTGGKFQQIGTLGASYTDPTLWAYRNSVLAGNDLTGAVLRIEDTTASTGRLLDVIKQGTSMVVIDNNGLVGIGVSTPTSSLSILTASASTNGLTIEATASQTANLFQLTNASGSFLSGFTAAGGLLMNISSTTALNIQRSGNRIFTVNTATGDYATSTFFGDFQVASSTDSETTPVFAIRPSRIAGAQYATSTFAGSVSIENGAFLHEAGSGITSIDNLQIGSLNFDTDAGTLSWADMPVTSSSASGVINSYSAMLDGNPLLTIYGVSDGAGGLSSMGVGIGATSTTAMLTASTTNESTTGVRIVLSGSSPTANAFEIRSEADTFLSGFTAAGGLLMNISSTTALAVQNGSGTNHFVVDTSSATATSTFTGGLIADTTTLVVNANENRVGIGTANPTVALDVTGNVLVSGTAAATVFLGDFRSNGAGSVSWVKFGPSGDDDNGLYFPAANTTAVVTTGAERMRIDSSGLVGIGVSTPTSSLSILTASASTNGLTIEATASQTANLFQLTNSSGTFLSGFTAAGGLLMNISSTTALNIQDGSGNNVFTVDTTQASTNSGIDITAGVSQAGNLFNFLNSSSQFLSGFTASGGLLMNISSTTALEIQNGGVSKFSFNTASGGSIHASSTVTTENWLTASSSTITAGDFIKLVPGGSFTGNVFNVLTDAGTAIFQMPSSATATTTLNTGINIDSDTLVVNANEGRVGIGTAAPNYSLTVADGLMALGTASNDAEARVYSYGNVQINLDDDNDGTNRFYIQSGADSVIFQIRETGEITASSTVTTENWLTASSSTITAGDFIKLVPGGSFTGNVFNVLTDAGTAIFQMPSSATATTTLNTGINIDSDTLVVNANEGRVGIGTATPSGVLQVIGSNGADGATSAEVGSLISLTTGNGGSTIVVGAGGAGGAFTLTTGNGGNGISGGSGGSGGDITLTAGNGGSGGSAGNGGSLVFNPGAAGSGSVGVIRLADIRGLVGIGVSTPTSSLSILTASASTNGLTIEATASQTANLFQLTNASGSFLSGFTASGGLLMNISSTTALEIQNSGTSAFRINTGSGSNEYATTTAYGYFRAALPGVTDGTVFSVDPTTGVTSADSLEVGAFNLGDNGGRVSWMDMQVTTTTAGLIMSYTAHLDSVPMLTLYAETNGSGFTRTNRVGVGTSTPLAFFDVSTTTEDTLILGMNKYTGANTPLLDLQNNYVSRFKIRNDGRITASSTVTTENWLTASSSSLTSGDFIKLVLNSTGFTGNIFNVLTDDGTAIFQMPDSATATTTLNTGINIDSDTLVVNANENRVGIGTATPTSTLHVVGNIKATGCILDGEGNVGTAACVDVAETYKVSGDIAAGEVAAFSGNGAEIARSSTAYQSGLAGIVSTAPALVITGSEVVMRGEESYAYAFGNAPLALSGRVPLRVTNANGAIQAGDLLVSSDIPGVAMKYDPENPRIPLPENQTFITTIGVALEDFDASSGTLLAFVNLGHQRLTLSASSDFSQLLAANVSDDANSTLFIKAARLAAESGQWSLDDTGKLVTKELETEKLKIASDKTVGFGRIKTGTTDAKISNTNVTEKSQIFVSFMSDLAGRSWYVAEKDSGTGFTVRLSGNLTYDADFSYWVVETDLDYEDFVDSFESPVPHGEGEDAGEVVEPPFSSPPSQGEGSEEETPTSTPEPIQEETPTSTEEAVEI